MSYAIGANFTPMSLFVSDEAELNAVVKGISEGTRVFERYQDMFVEFSLT